MQLQISKNDIINKFSVESDISSVTAPYLSFNNEYFLNLELSQEVNDSNFKINGKYFKVIQNLSNVLHLTDSFYKMMNVYPDTYRNMTEVPDRLDTSQLTTTEKMFDDCRSLTIMPQLDTSNVTSMKEIFHNCSSLTTVPELDTSKVTTMNGMFNGCTSLTSIPTLNISNVTNMELMFYNCNKLTSIPEMDTSKVTNMSEMFEMCSSLPATFPWTIDCSSISFIGSMVGMFGNSSVTKVYLKNVKQELRSKINSSLLKADYTLEIIFVDAEEPKKNIKSAQSITKSIDYGTTFNNIGLPNTVTVTLDDDSTVTLPVTWNSSSYVGTESGIQYITGTLTLNDNLTNTNNVTAVAAVEVAAQPVANNDWSLQFTLSTIQSEVKLDDIPGFSEKDTPSMEDFYGEDYDNQGRHLEIRYLGTQGNLTYAPDGVPVPNGCSSDEEVAAALNPDGIADYDPEAGNIMFSSGSAGTKVYMLVYHSEPFNS